MRAFGRIKQLGPSAMHVTVVEFVDPYIWCSFQRAVGSAVLVSVACAYVVAMVIVMVYVVNVFAIDILRFRDECRTTLPACVALF